MKRPQPWKLETYNIPLGDDYEGHAIIVDAENQPIFRVFNPSEEQLEELEWMINVCNATCRDEAKTSME